MRTLTTLSVAAVALATAIGALTHAADQTILGSKLVVKNPSTPEKRKVVGKAKEVGSPNTLVGDPVSSGASITVTANGGTPSQQTYALPAGTSAVTGKPFWSGDAIDGFTYKDTQGENGPAKAVRIKKAASGVFQITVLIDGKHGPVSVVPPNPGTDGCLRLAIAGGDSYSARFGAEGEVTNSGATRFKVERPLTEATCVGGSTSCTTSTTSTTITTPRFVDNGDGTITDNQTGLQWEKKDGADAIPGLGTPNLANPHDVDNYYTWSSSGDAADGTAFTDFLSRLNNCTSNDGSSVVAGGFAGHCDWRLPTITELQTIVDPSAPGCGSGRCCFPCIAPLFGPTSPGFHWSITSVADPLMFCDFSGAPCAFTLSFGSPSVDAFMKTLSVVGHVRAVRGCR